MGFGNNCKGVVSEVHGSHQAEINPGLVQPYQENEFASDGGRSFVTEVNQDLEKFDLRFSSTKTNAQARLMGNNKHQTRRCNDACYRIHATEIQYFKLIVEQIMLADNEVFSIPATAALREVSQLQGKGITKAEAEHVLSSFVAKGWLMKSKRGRYSLAPRALLELQTYLRDAYPDEYTECTTCLEPVTKGIACHTNNCGARLHIHCYAVVVRAARDRGVQCPTCGSSWEDESVRKIGEEAVKGNQTHRRAARGNEEEPEEEDLEEEMEDAMQGAESEDDMAVDESTQNSSVKNKKGKGQTPALNSAPIMDFDGTKRKQTIYVGGLHEDSNEAELMEIFSAFGDILDIQIPPAPTIHRDQPRNHGHRGFAFVTFSSPADAQDAIDNMDLNVVHGKVVKVNLAKAMKVEANPNRAVWESEEWLKEHAKPLDESSGQGVRASTREDAMEE
ncbi:Nse1 non-SMC component of SMC5-6 complex [Rhizoctonia solani]|uniref:Non-structural maintenance of chromosomes element 1 homolog n=1 Tax=Rhizoctonia solani TaxID=456999 RepID=A0A8H7M979_9AGAM|nr:Nse1 non-SMC component of SMC5-6 complex [Rhizoctonia solani]